MNILRRKRLSNGKLGPLERVKENSLTDLEKENLQLKGQIKSLNSRIEFNEELIAELAKKVY